MCSCTLFFLAFTSTTLNSFSLFLQVLRWSFISAKLGVFVRFDFILADVVLFVDVHLSALLLLVIHLIFVGVLVCGRWTFEERIARNVLRVEPSCAMSIKRHLDRNGRVSALVFQG